MLYDIRGTWLTVLTNIRTAQQNAVAETVPPTAMLRQSVGSTARRALRRVLWESAVRSLGGYLMFCSILNLLGRGLTRHQILRLFKRLLRLKERLPKGKDGLQ